MLAGGYTRSSLRTEVVPIAVGHHLVGEAGCGEAGSHCVVSSLCEEVVPNAGQCHHHG